jgi:hypothetical protein
MNHVALRWSLAALAALLVTPLWAADVALPARDPMQPPSNPSPALRSSAALSAPAPGDVTPRQVITIDGRRYVIDRGRRLGVGDQLGDARIERIDDGSVWLREGGDVHQVSLFGGIVKRAAVDADLPASRLAAKPASPKQNPVRQARKANDGRPANASSSAAASVASTAAPVSPITPNR